MPFKASAFLWLLEPLDRRIVHRIVEKHRGNRGVGDGDNAWTCQRHLKAMLFAQFAGLRSLRELAEGLAAQPSGLYHAGLRPVGKSTLGDASAARPSAVFRELAEVVLGGSARSARQDATALVQLIDGSPISLKDRRFAWAEADSRCRGLKLHMVYDPRAMAPVHFAVESPKVSEIKVARRIPLAAGITYVFDKGYTDYAWWQAIVDAGALFVTRLKANACRRVTADNPAIGAGILADRRVKIGHKQPRGGASNPLYETDLREVIVVREDKEPLHLVTNDHQRTAEEIAGLYKQRWQIELFFKWVKQNLKIKTFFGRSENAVRIQIYAALIAFCLLRIFQNAFAKGLKANAKALAARLRVALLDPFDTTGRHPPRPRPPHMRPPSPQFALDLGAP
ncbi:MAG: TRm22 transposase [Rhodocyclaceae bacterium]|nr:MAG: TRm22 transposase [Rhodocyclaceae bacterium]